MEAAAARRWGTGLEGRTVLVLGAGKVGGHMIRLLVQRQSIVIASDLDRDKVEEAVRAGAARIVDPPDASGLLRTFSVPVGWVGCSRRMSWPI